MTENLAGDLSIYDLWRSEAVRALVIPTRLFVSPADGSPSLTSFHLAIVHSFLLLHNIKVFIRPGGLYSSSTDIDSLRPYIDYVRDLYHTLLVGKAEILPALLFPPSQPLRDHLSPSAYQSFELDKHKYADYQAAVMRYIRYRQSFEDGPDTYVVAIVGCGHGPLIDVTIDAVRNCGTITGRTHGTVWMCDFKFYCIITSIFFSFTSSFVFPSLDSSFHRNNCALRVYAVEKNPAVLKALQERCAKHIKNHQGEVEISVVVEDMRTWQPPEQFDILLSEMLGDFGDNELSPECLAGPEKFLKRHGVSVPQAYTSFLCPVSCGKLYELIPKDGEGEKRYKERMYSFHVDYFKTLDDAKPVFTFQHPHLSGMKTSHSLAKYTSRSLST